MSKNPTFLERKQALPISHPNFYGELAKINCERAEWVAEIASKRFKLRLDGDFVEADKLRKVLEAEGVKVADGQNAVWWVCL